MLFTDIDSLVYETEAVDVHENFYWDKNLFYFSDYSQDSMFFDFVNKKFTGEMKAEFKEKKISAFVGLK